MDWNYKIFVVGDLRVGKTCLVKRFFKKSFSVNYICTMGMVLSSKTMNVSRIRTRINVFDMSGAELFKSIWSIHYKNAVGVVLVYDITKLESYENMLKWYSDVSIQVNPSAVFILVGNKSDLEMNREVPTELAKNFAKSHDFLFMETSALKDENVRQVFQELSLEIQSFNLGCIYHLENQSRSTVNASSLVNVKPYPRPKLITKPRECCPYSCWKILLFG
ncbi:unnamed protein product [Nezara viridula]|uniref:Uncharacterized protein n=1 Tax=Nezara viridula TaxID=85310 RepID=A0A9P0E8B4_NEZVI|nr:unnamed protein product [Nezara viridula]